MPVLLASACSAAATRLRPPAARQLGVGQRGELGRGAIGVLLGEVRGGAAVKNRSGLVEPPLVQRDVGQARRRVATARRPTAASASWLFTASASLALSQLGERQGLQRPRILQLLATSASSSAAVKSPA